MADQLPEIKRKLATGRYDPMDTERVTRDEARYLVRRLEAAEAALKEILSPTIDTQECAIDAWEKTKEGKDGSTEHPGLS